MANVVFDERWGEKGVQDTELFITLFGQFISLHITSNICAGSNFAYHDILKWFFSVFIIRVMRSYLDGYIERMAF